MICKVAIVTKFITSELKPKKTTAVFAVNITTTTKSILSTVRVTQ